VTSEIANPAKRRYLRQRMTSSAVTIAIENVLMSNTYEENAPMDRAVAPSMLEEIYRGPPNVPLEFVFDRPSLDFSAWYSVPERGFSLR